MMARPDGMGCTQGHVQPVNDLPNPYRTVENWAKMTEGRTWGSTSAVDIDPDGKSIWVAERCGVNTCAGSNLPVVLKFDASGKLAKSFGAGMFIFPHGIHADRQGNIWVTDGLPPGGASQPGAAGKGHIVVKFSPDGKVLLTLGKAGIAGDGPDTFNQPSDVITAPNGDIFVADGHGGNSNARIVKFTKDGKFIKSWGKKGSAAGEFDTPHGLAMDSRGRLFVADRNNNRIQIFDQEGRFLEEWSQFSRLSGIYIDRNNVLYGSDSESNASRHLGWKRGIRIGSAKDGKVTAFIPDPEANPDRASTSGAEGVAADAKGNIYGAEVGPRALKKYVKLSAVRGPSPAVEDSLEWTADNGPRTISAFVPEKGGEDETGPYEITENWPQPLPGHEGWVWGSTGGIFAETPDRVIVLQRGELPIPEGVTPGPGVIFGAPGRPATGGKMRMEHCILWVDRNGRIVDSWTQWDSLFEGGRGPHKVRISPYDPEKHIWIVDDNLHQIFKFTHDGKKLVMTLGERLVQGEDDKHFGRPTDIAWLPDGAFFISDGYINTRVVKFDKAGTFLMAWGTKGTGPGQFNLPHSIAIDGQRRVYVADRSNSRIQIFDENGKYLDQWRNIRQPYDLHMAADKHLWVLDGATNKILKYSLNGNLLSSWGTYGQFPGGLWGGHQMSVDQEANLYIAEVFNGRAQKFRPQKGVDPARLAGQPIRKSSSDATGRSFVIEHQEQLSRR